MKKYAFHLIIVASITLFSCKNKQLTDAEKKEKAKQEAAAKTKKIAAPCIADQIGDMDILISEVRDENLTTGRTVAIEKLRIKYVEYLNSLSVENINSKEAKDLIEKQKKLIEMKCLAEASKIVYKQALEELYEEQNK